jgi:hypothetical protein
MTIEYITKGEQFSVNFAGTLVRRVTAEYGQNPTLEQARRPSHLPTGGGDEDEKPSGMKCIGAVKPDHTDDIADKVLKI